MSNKPVRKAAVTIPSEWFSETDKPGASHTANFGSFFVAPQLYGTIQWLAGGYD